MTTTPTTPDSLYIPPGCGTLDQIGDQQIRICIQGPPFSGKTTAALTFPNPIILSYDKKVSAHKHRNDAILVPFHEPAFIDALVRRGTQEPVNRKEALILWLSTQGVKLSASQTLIVDGCSAVEESYHLWFDYNKDELAMGKNGTYNDFAEWNYKKRYFEEMHMAFKGLNCSVIFICHESPDRDKKGELNGKFRPLLTGQAGDKLGGNMTDLFRAIVISKPRTDEQVKKTLEWGRIDKTALEQWIASTPTDHQSIYLWQVLEDETCDCGTSSMKGVPKYIVANYETFCRYRK